MARGGEIAFLQIEQHTHACQSAKDAFVAKFLRQTFDFVQLGRHESEISRE